MAEYLDKSGTQSLINEIKSRLGSKIDKVDGMGLSQNSFTNAEKSKLANLENYDDTDIRSNKMDIPKIVSAAITELDAETYSDGTVCGYANDFAGISGTWVVIRTYTLNVDKTRRIQIAETSTGVRKTRLYNGEWGSWI